MKIILILAFLFCFSAYSQQSNKYVDSKSLLSQISTLAPETASKALALDKALRKAVAHYKVSRDKRFITQVLKNYEIILKKDVNHYLLEMFYPIHSKNKKAFRALLDKALSPSAKKDFLERMKIVEREEVSGNG